MLRGVFREFNPFPIPFREVYNLWASLAEASPTQAMSIEFFICICRCIYLSSVIPYIPVFSVFQRSTISVNAHVRYYYYFCLSMRYDVETVQKKFYCSRHGAKLRNFAVSESTWSLQLRENKDFNTEEKGSKLIEQRRLQLKRSKDWENIGREIRRGELWREKNRELQGYRESKRSRQSIRYSAETE